MIKIGNVIEVFSANKDTKGLPRPKVDSLDLIVDYGIKNDKFAGKNLNQTVMIVGLKSYELSKNNHIELVYGSLGENVLLDFDPHDYEVGDIFYIGNSKIEITQVCTVCNHLSVFDEKLPKLLKSRRGLYCKIVSSGLITKKMDVRMKEKI